MNWILKAGKPVHVDLFVFWEIFETTVKCVDWLEDCEGIPLTPEILGKFGFEKSALTGKCPLYFMRDKGFVIVDFGGGLRLDSHCFQIYTPHVHQLQNLYFALTGEELNNIVL